MFELFRSQHAVVHCHHPGPLMVFVRRPEAFRTLDEMVACFEDATAAVDKVLHARYGLIVDTREGPVRNDPEFEAVFARLRRPLLNGFARRVVIVRTAVGKLHAQRHTSKDSVPVAIAFTPREALDYCKVDEDLSWTI